MRLPNPFASRWRHPFVRAQSAVADLTVTFAKFSYDPLRPPPPRKASLWSGFLGVTFAEAIFNVERFGYACEMLDQRMPIVQGVRID